MHFCVVPGCVNSSSRGPGVSFHRLPLKDKRLLKVWIHKIRRKNLPLNSNSRVCSLHFVNSSGYLLRKDEFPTENLPLLPTRVVPRRRKLPKERGISDESGSTGLTGGLVPASPVSPTMTGSGVSDASINTDVTVGDMKLLEDENVQLRKEIDRLKSKIESQKFSLHNIAARNEVAFYTGFPSLESLNACFEYLGPAVNNLTYWNGGKSRETDGKSKGRPRSLLPLEEFFLVLVRLRLGLLEQDLADRFEISCATVSRIFTTWINFLYFKFKELPLWPRQDVVRNNMPKAFKSKYFFARVILDATEIYVDKPYLPDVQQLTYSSYKNDNTFKGLVGISPAGAITFVSDLYAGGISDKKLTQSSGILSLLDRGDSVMADRGFDIQDDLTPLGVKLNMPPFL